MWNFALDTFCFATDRLRVAALAFAALALWSGLTATAPGETGPILRIDLAEH
jgi:hypothetical protein